MGLETINNCMTGDVKILHQISLQKFVSLKSLNFLHIVSFKGSKICGKRGKTNYYDLKKPIDVIRNLKEADSSINDTNTQYDEDLNSGNTIENMTSEIADDSKSKEIIDVILPEFNEDDSNYEVISDWENIFANHTKDSENTKVISTILNEEIKASNLSVVANSVNTTVVSSPSTAPATTASSAPVLETKETVIRPPGSNSTQDNTQPKEVTKPKLNVTKSNLMGVVNLPPSQEDDKVIVFEYPDSYLEVSSQI